MTDGITNPTIETVLERINALGLNMGERMDTLGARVEKLESGVSQMRQDIKTGFRKVGRAITLLDRDFLSLLNPQHNDKPQPCTRRRYVNTLFSHIAPAVKALRNSD